MGWGGEEKTRSQRVGEVFCLRVEGCEGMGVARHYSSHSPHCHAAARRRALWVRRWGGDLGALRASES